MVSRGEEDDKMLPGQPAPPSREVLELQKSIRNMKRVLGICFAAFFMFAALLVLRNHRQNKLMIPQILRTPVPPSQCKPLRNSSRAVIDIDVCSANEHTRV